MNVEIITFVSKVPYVWDHTCLCGNGEVRAWMGYSGFKMNRDPRINHVYDYIGGSAYSVAFLCPACDSRYRPVSCETRTMELSRIGVENPDVRSQLYALIVSFQPKDPS